ncbi:class F sortase [Actinoplanes sp. NPDC026670]|uniref:class F sortase n=1 Tax=Actinoplanes sp. NPDC026670 TaxID=3154700 RepID=UPI0033C0E020
MSVSHRNGPLRQSPGRAAFLVVLGVMLALTAVLVVRRSQPAADFGAPPAGTPIAPTASAAPMVRVPITDGTLPASPGDTAPTRLRIPALDLDATVDAVGIDAATGDFAVPPSVDRVGWYRYGPGFSADAGSIVIAGHVDSAAQGRGAFFALGTLDAGDPVTLTGPGGQTREFEVVARKRYAKSVVPLQDYFARDGTVRLTLITCGGPFDPETRHYRDNVVVTAIGRPAAARGATR